jgi:HSP20 family protein
MMQQEINQLFDDFLRGVDTERGCSDERSLTAWPGTSGSFTPTINLSETDNAFEATVELPGMSEEDVDVKVTREGLVIGGEKRTETSEQDEERSFYRQERRYGYFQRTVPLPAGVIDREACEATFSNGVLTVRLPKQPNAQPSARRITVRRGD